MGGVGDKEPKEEVRRIQLTGKSTYIISLPKRWVMDMNLKAGSQLAISRQSDASLILTPKELVKPVKLGEASVMISQKDDPNTIVRKIIALYLAGYSLIAVKAKDERVTSLQRNVIKNLVRNKLVGVEVVSDSHNEMKLQVLLSYPELSVESALRRMCLIAISMHEDAMQALRSLDEKLAKDVIMLDDEVDRFGLYIIRQLKAAVQSERILKDIGLESPRDCLGYRVIVKFVERIADHAVKIAENALLLDAAIDDPILGRMSEMSSLAVSVFNDSIKSLYKGDYQLADSVIDRARTITSIEGEVMKLIAAEKAETSKMLVVRMIVESVRRVAEYASDIAEVVLNLNVNQIVAHP